MRGFIIAVAFILFSNIGYSQITEEYTLKNIGINDSDNNAGVSFFKQNYLIHTKPKKNQKIHDTDFYVSMADETGTVFEGDLLEGDLNSFINEIDLVFTHDFKKLYFTRSYIDNKKNEHFDIYSADVTEENKFVNIKPLAICYNNFSTAYPSLSKDEKTLYFTSNRRESMGGFDIFKVAILENGKRFGKVINLGPKVNTPKDEITPFVIDGKLYFSSNGRGGLGMQDIFSIKLDLESDAVNLGESLNSPKDDYDYLRKPYRNFGYISSNRDSGRGKSDIYFFKVKEITPIYVEPEIIEEEFVVEKDEKDETEANIDKSIQDKEIALANQKVASSIIKTKEKDKIYIPKEVVVKQVTKEETKIVSKQSKEPNTEVVTNTINKLTEVVPVTEEKIKEGVKSNEEIKSNKEDMESSYIAYEEEIIYEEKEELAGNFYAFQRRKVYNTILVETGRVLKKRKEFTKLEKSCVNKIEKLDDIYFDLNKFNIRPDAQIQVNKAIKIMEKCPNVNFVASSFTDSRGSAEYNRKLSQRRADSVVNYILANSSIMQERIKGIGYGESGLKNKCYNGVKCSEKEHQVNRRTEIEVYILK